jgi:Skp family chaperone for outer membrane proteins
MKRLLSILALVAPLALGGIADAQTTKPAASKVPIVIAVVDGNKLTQSAKAMKDAQAEAEKLAKKFDADFAAEQKKLQAEYHQLEKDRLKITGEEYDRRLQRLNQRFADIRRTAQVRQQQMSRAVRIVQLEFRNEVVKVIQAIAVESGYTLVLERSAVLHSTAQFDITDEVLARLDKAKLNVKFEFPPKADVGEPPARTPLGKRTPTPRKKTN